MNRFKKLLVPVDFSAYSAEAMQIAAELARPFDASLTLIHVYDPLIYALPEAYVLAPPTEMRRLIEAFDAELEGARRQAIEAGAPRVETKLLQGVVPKEIVDCARNGEFDLIVMGTHGRSGVTHFLIGSVAERVLRSAPCPVLTVKKPAGKRVAANAPARDTPPTASAD